MNDLLLPFWHTYIPRNHADWTNYCQYNTRDEKVFLPFNMLHDTYANCQAHHRQSLHVTYKTIAARTTSYPLRYHALTRSRGHTHEPASSLHIHYSLFCRTVLEPTGYGWDTRWNGIKLTERKILFQISIYSRNNVGILTRDLIWWSKW